MNLLDRAVKLAAEQDEPDEMNFVRKHAREQVRLHGCESCRMDGPPQRSANELHSIAQQQSQGGVGFTTEAMCMSLHMRCACLWTYS